jgi:hypothetical protein
VFSKSENSLASEGNIIVYPEKQNLYGQCWTFERDSDALWRIYSPDKFGIRVRATIKNLFESFERNCVANNCFIGKVKYKPYCEIVNQLKDLSSSEGLAKTLLYKREEFTHEEEVRLIYHNSGEEKCSNVFQYSFDPLKIITEVALDPRLSEKIVEVFINYIQSLGFKQNQIIQSPLYKLPKLTAYAKDT